LIHDSKYGKAWIVDGTENTGNLPEFERPELDKLKYYKEQLSVAEFDTLMLNVMALKKYFGATLCRNVAAQKTKHPAKGSQFSSAPSTTNFWQESSDVKKSARRKRSKHFSNQPKSQ